MIMIMLSMSIKMEFRGNAFKMVSGASASIPIYTVAAGYFAGTVHPARRVPVAQMAA